eukprot:9503999-Pyramimonas_sp.AAC.4
MPSSVASRDKKNTWTQQPTREARRERVPAQSDRPHQRSADDTDAPFYLGTHDDLVRFAARALAWVLHQADAGVAFITGGKDLAIATTRVVGARSGAVPRELLETSMVINIQHLDKRSPRKGRAVDNLLVRPQGPEAVQDALVCGVGNLHRHVVAHSQSIQAGSDVQTLELGAPSSEGFEAG